MNLAFQISEDDVANVLASNTFAADFMLRHTGMSVEAVAASLMPLLDMTEIENAALYGGNLDEQTDYARDEITNQLRAMEVLVPADEEPRQRTRADVPT